MYRLLLSVVMIIPFFVISVTSSVAEPLTMFLLGAGLVGLSTSMPGKKKK
jgi:hypothetical protein